jgi:gas vesicle protein
MVKYFKLALFLFLFTFIPFISKAADLTITPYTATYEVGDTVTLQVVTSTNVPLNAISANIVIPKTIFSIESVSKAGSILNFWTSEPSFSKSTNTISLEGVSLGGFQGTAGTVITIRLKAIASGSGKIVFQSGQILANDGQGTDITGTLSSVTYTVKDVQIKPKQKETPVKYIAPIKDTTPSVEETPVKVEENKQNSIVVSPEISLGLKYGEPAIVGQSNYPKSQVLLTFISSSGTKIFINGVTDANGDFTLLVPNSLKHGSYKVTGIVILQNGKNSPDSNEINVSIGNIFSDMSKEMISLFGILVLITMFQFWKISTNTQAHVSKKVKQELNDVSNTIHKSFTNLKGDMRGKKISEIKSELTEMEEKISKEVKNIDSI